MKKTEIQVNQGAFQIFQSFCAGKFEKGFEASVPQIPSVYNVGQESPISIMVKGNKQEAIDSITALLAYQLCLSYTCKVESINNPTGEMVLQTCMPYIDKIKTVMEVIAEEFVDTYIKNQYEIKPYFHSNKGVTVIFVPSDDAFSTWCIIHLGNLSFKWKGIGDLPKLLSNIE